MSKQKQRGVSPKQGNTFGVRLRQLRMQRVMSLNKLADKLGVSAQYLGMVELGKRQPLVHGKVKAVAKILEVDEGELWSLARKSKVYRLTEQYREFRGMEQMLLTLLENGGTL